MLLDFFTYQFIQHALLASLLGGVTAGIIGTYVVTRRIVFITGGITHASFGGLGLGYLVGINPLLGAGIFAILAGLGVEKFSRRKQIREDSLIAIAWSLGMALGIIFIYLTPGYAPNLMSYLFGNILSVSWGDLISMGILMLVVILFFILFFRTIQFITFDEEFARTHQLPVSLFKYLLIILVSITAVLYIRVAGIILVLSMLTIPQNTALLFTHNYRNIILLSILFSIFGSFLGLIVSFYWNIPSGASIIFCLIIVYLLCSLIKPLIIKRVKS